MRAVLSSLPYRMIHYLLFVIFLSQSALADLKNQTEELNQLVTVVLIFRHGDRVIINPYPTDPYKNSSYWPAGWGQLTNEGKMQEYVLGTWFRERYKDFLPSIYSEKDIFVRSTDVDRTLMSAAASLAGLYPPKAKQIWDKDLLWQPIPIHTKPEREDYLVAMKKPCPHYDMLKRQLVKSPEFIEINRKNKDLIDYVAQHTGSPITNFDQLEYVYNALTIESKHNFTLPEWTKSVFPDKMKPLADFSFAVPCYTTDMARLKTGPFFHELLDHFFNVTESMKHKKPNRKMWMYSGHDTTIANVLQSLGLFQYHSPPYSSTIIFEVRYRGSAQFIVNVFYKNSSDPQKMILKGCDFDCPLEEFVNLLDPINVDVKDWERECSPSLLSFVESADREDLVVVVCILFISLVIFAVMVKVIYSKYNKNESVYLRLPDDDEQV